MRYSQAKHAEIQCCDCTSSCRGVFSFTLQIIIILKNSVHAIDPDLELIRSWLDMSTWALITAFGWGHLQSPQNQNLALSDTLHPCCEEESFRPRSVSLDLWCKAKVKTSRYGCKTEQFNSCSIVQQLKGCFLRTPLFSPELRELFLPVTVFIHCSYLLMPEAPAE